MNENDLMNALDDRADAIQVGPAPLDTMTRAAARTRRRNTFVAGGAALAVVAVVGVGATVALSGGGDGTAKDTTPQVAAQDVPPDGYVYVGVGTAAIAVPDDWPRNDTTCSQVSNGDTYIIDQGGNACLMLVPYPADTTSVRISPADQTLDTSGWTPVEVDGVDALRSPTASGEPIDGGAPLTTISVFLPDQGALFTADSSVSEEDAADLLAGIVVLDDHVAVPGYSDLGLDGGRADDAYIQRLTDLGLEVEMLPQLDRMKRTPGEIIAVEPQSGTVVEPGSTVTVTAAR